MGINTHSNLIGKMKRTEILFSIIIYLLISIYAVKSDKVLIGIKQKSVDTPNNCIYQYNEDVESITASCKDYIGLMMDNYNLDENSVPIAPAYQDPSLPKSKQQALSMQLYVGSALSEPQCNFTLQKIVNEEACCSGYENYPYCNTSVCYSDQGGCSNGGVCTSPNLCSCPPDYSGLQCDEDNPIIIESKHPLQLYCYQSDQCFSFKKNGYAGHAVSYDDCCGDKTGSWGSQSGQCVSCNANFHMGNGKNDQNFTTCHSYGSDSFRTFDDQIYTFQGRCKYILTTPSDSSSSSWSISLVYENCASDSGCIKRVLINSGDTIIKSSDDGLFYQADSNKPLSSLSIQNTESAITVPGTSMYVMRQDDYVLLALEAGNVKVKWDNHTNIVISAHNSIFNGDLKGLCGNADNNFENDFKGFDNIASFGNSFKGAGCPDIANTISTCKSDDKILANQQCGKIRLKFPGCSDLVNSDKYFSMCVQNICSRSQNSNTTLDVPGVTDIVCTHLSAYSGICSERGSCIQWRSDTLCETKCPGNKVWSDCASECPTTCRNLFQIPSAYCQASKVGRCICGPGEVEFENKCIKPEKCPCLYDGKEHPPGTVRQFDCNTCTCNSSLWYCTEKICPSTCEIMGTQFNTFDGGKFAFNDAGCQYVVLEPAPENSDERANVIVLIQSNIEDVLSSDSSDVYINKPKIITIKVNGSEIILKATTPGLGDSPTNIFIDGEDHTTKLPYTISDKNIYVRKLTNIYSEVSIGSHFKLYFDGSRTLYIKASDALKNNIIGLCGKFDGNSENDFTEKNNNIPESIVNIAKSYLTGTCDNIPINIIDPPVGDNDICSQILNGPEFSACMNSSKVNKEFYATYCRREQAAAKRTLGYCSAILNAAIQCRRFSVQYEVPFTSNLLKPCIPICQSGGTIFQICSRTCQSTCRELSENSATKCDDDCYPGCDCPPNYYKTGSGQCVSKSECTCWNPNKPKDPEVPAGTNITINCKNCICASGSFKCTINKNCSNPICPKNQVYLETGSACNTCSNYESCTDTSIIQNSCGCPNGTISKKDGTCVQPADCPCTYMSKEYAPDDVITIKCAKYICKNRAWNLLSQETANCEAVCIAYGDPHYRTLDGQMYSFQGSCMYTLMQTPGDSLNNIPPITISVANIACGFSQVTCTKHVQVAIGDQTFLLSRGNNDTIPIIPKYGVVIEHLTFFTQLVSDSLGLRLLWDKSTRVYLFLKPTYQGNVQGLCGNYDGDIQNEYMHGTMKYEDSIQFAESFIANADICPYEISPENNGVPAKEQDMCNANPDRKDWAEQMCGIMKDTNGVFKSCIEAMHQDVNIYYSNCLYDACGCNRGGDCECLCTSLATFATQCAFLGSPVKWRSQSLCPIMCEGGKHYSACASPCPETCDTIGSNVPLHCNTTHCVEGCVCPNGMIDQNGECVPPSSCPCYHNGLSYVSGSVVNMDNCKKCQCLNTQFNCTEDYKDCVTTCTPDQFRCNDGKCINSTKKCDGVVDCFNSEDEINCKCDPQEFQCVSNGKCIPFTKKCDGTQNCVDNSDETSCVTCLPHQFHCNISQNCIDISKKCDGKYDCGPIDQSDEENCKKCDYDEYLCSNNQTCIPLKNKCDGHDDCGDGSDEHGCKCICNQPEMILCNNNNTAMACQCINASALCDGKVDCNNGMDESSCTTTKTKTSLGSTIETISTSISITTSPPKECERTNGMTDTNTIRPSDISIRSDGNELPIEKNILLGTSGITLDGSLTEITLNPTKGDTQTALLTEITPKFQNPGFINTLSILVTYGNGQSSYVKLTASDLKNPQNLLSIVYPEMPLGSDVKSAIITIFKSAENITSPGIVRMTLDVIGCFKLNEKFTTSSEATSTTSTYSTTTGLVSTKSTETTTLVTTTSPPKECERTNGMTDTNTIRPSDISIRSDGNELPIEKNILLGTSGITLDGSLTEITLNPTKGDTQTALLTEITPKFENTEFISTLSILVTYGNGQSSYVKLTASDLKNPQNLLSIVNPEMPLGSDVKSAIITISKSAENITRPEIVRMTLDVIGCFNPTKGSTETLIQTTTSSKWIMTTRPEIPTSTKFLSTTTLNISSTTSPVCEIIDGMTNPDIILPSDISLSVDNVPLIISRNNSKNSLGLFIVQGSQIVIVVDTTSGDKFEPLLSEINLKFDNPLQLSIVYAQITLANGKNETIPLLQADIIDSSNILSKFKNNIIPGTEISKIVITIFTSKDLNQNEPIIKIELEIKGCFEKKYPKLTTTRKETTTQRICFIF